MVVGVGRQRAADGIFHFRKPARDRADVFFATRRSPIRIRRSRQELERVVARGGQQIPEDRMFLMHASSKLTELNAYVTGLGASRRVVVWDTTIARMTAPQIAFVFGHEMGHYVLGHVLQGLIFGAGLLLIALWLGSHIGFAGRSRAGGPAAGRGGCAASAIGPASPRCCSFCCCSISPPRR